ncbi:hypothetical protein CN417_00505 [Bacillus thuringiensis]|uniref:outer membrane protein assembly factor BamB family protein n=1 Tax=Bacillus thuringiensis TaxID=1428 RepID=UPI000BF6833E|nr:PQQ-binding-like beta-propeller repeat protein [Bacillus thuringiensis]PEV15732.1 hypothetical protein CN417_00505 [Bacillus thuringiensis]
MKKKFMLMMLLFVLMVGLHPNLMTKAESTSVQGEQFEQGKYDLKAESPFGYNWNKNSPYAGTETGKVKWEYKLYKKDGDIQLFSAPPAIGSDGTIYIGNYNRKLYALNPDGSIKWIKDGVAHLDTTPVIAEDGTIYVVYRKLTALNPDGSIKWQAKDENALSTPIIDSEGTVYVHDSKSITAYNSDGSKKWESSKMLEGAISGRNSMVMSKDGTIYTLISSGENYFIYAHDKNGKELWKKQTRGGGGNPGFSLGLDNELYISAGSVIFVFDKDGNLIKEWKPGLGNAVTISSKDGAIYTNGGSAVTAYNRDYTIRWKFSPDEGVVNSPIIDKNGVVYVHSNKAVFAINPDGTLKWKMPFSSFHPGAPNDAITIGRDGTLYMLGYVPELTYFGPDKTYYSVVAIGDSYTDTVCTKDSTYMQVLKSLEAKSKNAKLTNEEKKEARDILKKLSDDLDKADK